MYGTAGCKLILVLILCIAIITPAIADPISDPLGEQATAMQSNDYLKYQWDIENFTVSGQQSSFWIVNFKAPAITLSGLSLMNTDDGSAIPFNYTQKLTMNGNSTATLWNLFGLLDPGTTISTGEQCQINFQEPVNNITVIYGGCLKNALG